AIHDLENAQRIRLDALPIRLQPEAGLLDPAQRIDRGLGKSQELAVEGLVVHANAPVQRVGEDLTPRSGHGQRPAQALYQVSGLSRSRAVRNKPGFGGPTDSNPGPDPAVSAKTCLRRTRLPLRRAAAHVIGGIGRLSAELARCVPRP